MPRKCLVILVALVTLTLSLNLFAADKGVQIAKLDDHLRIEIDGKLFTQYHFKDVPRPFFYPVLWHNGAGLTRNWPMKEGVEGEETDHQHHRGVWFGHRHVNGKDFWGESPKSGKIVHQEFLEIKSGSKEGVIRERNHYITVEGAHMLTEERTIRIPRDPKNRIMDWEVTFIADQRDIVFGDDKDAGMSIRVPHSMKLRYRSKKAATGHIVNSEGHKDDDTWGKSAKWCDYHGMVEGRHLGIAIFDHPSNPRFPTWWHVRSYGLFAANAFGKRHFEKLKDPHAGDLPLPKGERISWRYRLYWHEGDAKQGQVEKQWQAFADSAKSRE